MHPSLRSNRVLLKLSLLSVLSIALWMASYFIRTSTPVTLTIDGLHVSATIFGETATAPFEATWFTGLTIMGSRSFYPQRWSRLTIHTQSTAIVDDDLSNRSHAEALDVWGTGDWYLDTLEQLSIYSLSAPLHAPLRVSLDLFGWSVGSTSIKLTGQRPLSVDVTRGFIGSDVVIRDGNQAIAQLDLAPPLGECIRSIAEPVIYSAFYACLLAILALLLRHLPGLSRELPRVERLVANCSSSSRLCITAVAILCTLSLGISLWMATEVFEGLPHFQDDMGYLLRAKWLVAGHLSETEPAFIENVAYPHTYTLEGRWYSIYPLGWPALLAIGELFGHPELVSPLCGAASIFLIYGVAYELYRNRAVALCAATLSALSPMSQLMWSSMLSHAGSSTLLLLALLFLCRARRLRSVGFYWLAGIAVGLAFCVRPLTALTVGIPAALILTRAPIRENATHISWGRSLSIFACGVALGSLPQLVDNLLTTGAPLRFAYSVGFGHRLSFANVPNAIRIAAGTMPLNLSMTFGWLWGTVSGWPVLGLTYAFIFVAAFIRKEWENTLLLLSIIGALPFAYLLHEGSGVHGFGPRFYYDGYFALFILTARGMHSLCTDAPGRRYSVASLVTGVACVFLISSAIPHVLKRNRSYYGYNSVDGRLAESLRSEGIDHGILLLKSWYDVASLARYLPGSMQGATKIPALDVGDNSAIELAFPHLPIFYQEDHMLRPNRPTEEK